MIKITENSQKVLDYLQKHPEKEFTKHELVEKLDISMAAVTGSVNGLLRKGLAEERLEVFKPLNAGGKPTEIRWVKINEAGLKFDPVEEERRIAREKAEATALRKQARAQAKLERAKRNAVL